MPTKTTNSRVVTLDDVVPNVPKAHYELASQRIVEPPFSGALKASRVRMQRGGYADAHVHADAEQLFIVTAGCMGLDIAGTAYRLDAGQSALVKPGELHGNYNLADGETEYFVVSTPVPR